MENNVIGTIISGYEITGFVNTEENMGYAIAFNPKAPSPFVTWQIRVDDEVRADLGHYFEDMTSAQLDLMERCMEVIKYNRSQEIASQEKTKDTPTPEKTDKLGELSDLSKSTAAAVFKDSDSYKKYLDTVSKVPNMSARNTLLIHSQNPNAAMLKTFDVWRYEKRHINKGEKGVTIIVPKTDKDGKPITNKKGDSVFTTTALFDVSQTTAKDNSVCKLPDLSVSISGLTEMLQKTSPLPLAFVDEITDDKAMQITYGDNIQINNSLNDTDKLVATLQAVVAVKLHDVTLPENAEHRKSIFAKDYAKKEFEQKTVMYTIVNRYGIELPPNVIAEKLIPNPACYDFAEPGYKQNVLSAVQHKLAELTNTIDKEIKITREVEQEIVQEVAKELAEENTQSVQPPAKESVDDTLKEPVEISCAEAISKAISDNYDGYRLNKKALTDVASVFEPKTIAQTLAATINSKDGSDPRIIKENYEWAKTVEVSNPSTIQTLNDHPGLVNIMANFYRSEYEPKQEKAVAPVTKEEKKEQPKEPEGLMSKLRAKQEVVANAKPPAAEPPQQNIANKREK